MNDTQERKENRDLADVREQKDIGSVETQKGVATAIHSFQRLIDLARHARRKGTGGLLMSKER